MRNGREGLIFGLAGASIGLVVWFASSWILDGVPVMPEIQRNIYWPGILYGLLPVGILIGATLPVLESVRRESFGGALRSWGSVAALGALLAGGAALLGGAAGDWLFVRVRDTGQLLAGRLMGGLVFGLMMGLAVGVTERIRLGSSQRLTSAVAGGILGGAIASVTFESLGGVLKTSNVLALSYTVLGGLVAAAIGVVTRMRTQAFLTGVAENQRKYQVWDFALPSDNPTVVGSAIRPSPKATLKLYNDDTIEREHAVVVCRANRWYVQRPSKASRGDLFVNGREVGGTPLALQHNDVIRIGQLRFRFVYRAEAQSEANSVRAKATLALLLLTSITLVSPPRVAAVQSGAESKPSLRVREVSLLGDGRVILWVWQPDASGKPVEFESFSKDQVQVTRGAGGEPLTIQEVRSPGAGGRSLPLYYLVVVDTSGSMKERGKAKRVADAVTELLGWIRSSVRGEVYVRIQAFDDNVPARTTSGEVLDTGAFLPVADPRLASLNLRMAQYVYAEPTHDTHLYRAARQAPTVFLDSNVKAESQKRIVLLTDGKSDIGGGITEPLRPESVREEVKRAGIPFYTIGYEVAADDTGFLQGLAGDTRGEWKLDASADHIRAMFKHVVVSAQKELGLVILLPQNIAPSENFVISGVGGVLVPLSWLLGPYPVGASAGVRAERWMIFAVLSLALLAGSVLVAMLRPAIEPAPVDTSPRPSRIVSEEENPFAYKPEVKPRRRL